MRGYSFVAAGFIAVSLIGTPAVFANAGWTYIGDAGRHDIAPSTRLAPPGPFLQINPAPYLYPQVPQQRPPQYGQQPYGVPEGGQGGQRKEQQRREHQWRESQWQDRQQDEQIRPGWRDWGQHDRSDRFSREREGRDRDWHDRREQGNQSDRDASMQSGTDATRNVPTWGYRENHH
jgi:hypothetical protein